MKEILILIIIAFASLIKGITGFGFALMSLPPLLFWYSPKEIVPVLLLCNLFSSTIIVLQKKERKLVNKNFRTLIMYGALFTIVGVITLKYINENLLINIMGVFFILLSIFSLLGVKYQLKLTKISYKIAGVILGFLTGTISVSGPPLAIFLNSANVDNQEFREIFSWFSVVTATIAILGYALIGILTPQTFKMTAVFLPILYIGSYIGKRLNNRIPQNVFKKISIYMSLIASIFLLAK